MPDNNLKALAPDLYSRNTVIAYLIHKLIPKPECRVLDVGGRDSRLNEFLNNGSRYVLLDKQSSKPPFNFAYIVGDARKIPFSDRNFDVVVSSDMIEHMEEIDREKALNEMLRVSKNFLIFGAPFRNSLVETAEDYVRAQYHSTSGQNHPFLVEHDRYGLPDEEKFDKMLTDKGLNFIKINEGNLMNWYIQQLYTGAHYGEEITNGHFRFNKFFNEHLYELGNLREPAYRIIYCISKSEPVSKAELLTELHAKHTWKAETFMELLQVAFEDLRGVTDRKKHDLKVLKSELENRKNELASDKNQYEQTLTIARKSVEAHRQAIMELRNFLAEKERALQYIKLVLIEKVGVIEEQEKDKKMLGIKIEELEETLNQYKEYHAIAAEENFVLNKKYNDLQKEFEAKNTELEEVKMDLTNHRAELAKVNNSRAWKLVLFYGKLKNSLIVSPFRLLKKGWNILMVQGAAVFAKKLTSKIRRSIGRPAVDNPYQLYCSQNELGEIEIESIKNEINNFKYQPVISIAMPVYNIDEKWLNKAVESVKKQLYPRWELCICDDASTSQSLKNLLQKYSKEDKRIRIVTHQQNKGIAGASNSALKLASGAYVGFLDDDDELTPDALYEVVKSLQENKFDLVYSDEDKIDLKGQLSEPCFKPDWSPDLLLSNNYICHFAVYRRKLLEDINGFREGYDGSQDYDLVLRFTEKTANIRHISKVLYHWRKIPGSTSADVNAKPYALISAKAALAEAVKRRQIHAEINDGMWTGSYRVHRRIEKKPLVSIIIPFKDLPSVLEKCVDSILTKTTYGNYEIILVDNQSNEAETFSLLERIGANPKVRILKYNQPFNFSAINNFAVNESKGDVIVMLNNDTEVITPEWLESMLEHVLRQEVGAVGAKLIYPNNTVQHAGVIMGLNGIANHAFCFNPADDHGYFGQANVIKNCSAVTGACLMTRKELYQEFGGLDEQNLKISFNDVDLCLRLGAKGYSIVYTPYARLYHHESLSRGREVALQEIDYMQKKYGNIINAGDPFYNPNLTTERFDFSLRINDMVQ